MIPPSNTVQQGRSRPGPGWPKVTAQGTRELQLAFEGGGKITLFLLVVALIVGQLGEKGMPQGLR